MLGQNEPRRARASTVVLRSADIFGDLPKSINMMPSSGVDTSDALRSVTQAEVVLQLLPSYSYSYSYKEDKQEK